MITNLNIKGKKESIQEIMTENGLLQVLHALNSFNVNFKLRNLKLFGSSLVIAMSVNTNPMLIWWLKTSLFLTMHFRNFWFKKMPLMFVESNKSYLLTLLISNKIHCKKYFHPVFSSFSLFSEIPNFQEIWRRAVSILC